MPEPENPEDRQRRLLAAMLQPAMGASPGPSDGAMSAVENPDLWSLRGPGRVVEPPPPPPEPGIRETMPDLLPVRPETGTMANFGTPAAYTSLAPGLRTGPSAIQPVYSGTKDASGMTDENYDQAPTPRLADILTPQEEADRRLAHEPVKKRGAWGAVGDVLKGILYGLQTGQGAIAGGLYGGTGQGREDARKMHREEVIGEITRNRGMQDAMRMQQLETLAKQGDIAASRELANLRRTQAQVALTEKPAKYGFGGFDQPMITATDPTTGAIRQYKNEGYLAKPKPAGNVEWVDQPDGSQLAFERDENGKPKVVMLEDGSAWRKVKGEKETAGDRDNDVETAAAAWLDSQEGKNAWGAAVEFAQNQRLSTFGVTRSNYQTELKRLEDVIAQRLPDPDDDAAAYQNAVKDKQSAQKRADEIRKAIAEGEKAGTEAWKDVAKRRATAGAGGGGGTGGGGSFSGVSGFGGGR